MILGKGKIERKKLDDKGSALVLVIIAMAFIGILVVLISYTALFNFHMKVNNLKTKDSFYSAETALDEIRVGLEKDVSDSLSTAYTKVLKTFSAMSAEEKRFSIRYDYFTAVQRKYNTYYDSDARADVTAPDAYDLRIFRSYLTTTGADVTLDAKLADNRYNTDHGVLTVYEDGVVFKDLRITYRDSEGYVSVIETDIKLKMPDLEFAQTGSLPALSDFSLVARDAVVTVEPGERTIGGSMYAGEVKVGEDLVTATLKFEEDSLSPVAERRVVVKDMIDIAPGSSVEADSYGELWMGGANLRGNSTLFLRGNDVYMKDDITITGKDNSMKIGELVDDRYSGALIGFGNGYGDAEDASVKESSSAIIVNGTGTDIDLDHVTNLTLAGNSYIDMYSLDTEAGQRTFVANPDDPAVLSQVRKNVVMGQSIAVKSDQLAYLVPAECIAVANAAAGVDMEGKSVLTNVSNPITREEYMDAFFRNDGTGTMVRRSEVDKINVDIPCESLGGKTLSYFGIDANDVRIYCHQVNNVTTLYYFYIAFDITDEQDMINAANYFETYYDVNKETMNAYQSIYTDAVRFRNPATSFYTLHLAGNLVHTDGSSFDLQTDTLAHDRNNSEYSADLESYSAKFDALCLKMVDVFAQLTTTEKTLDANGQYINDVYSNIVDESMIDDFASAVTAGWEVMPFLFGVDGDAVRGVVSQLGYTYNGSSGFTKGMIIAKGDVYVGANFEGTIISGGTVYLKPGVTVKPDNLSVHMVLTYKESINGNEYQFSDFLIGGSGYLSGENRYFDTNSVSIPELIVYENWEKQ